MRNATDKQLKDWGWLWALRFEGELMAVTVSPFDASIWMKEKVGEVIALRHVH